MSSSKSICCFWSNIFCSSQLLLKLSVLTLQILNFNHGWLHVLFDYCVIFVRAFGHVFNESLEIAFGLCFIQCVLLIDNVLFDISQCIIKLLYFFSFCGDNLFEVINLLIKFFFFLLELFLFSLPFKRELIELLFKFFRIDSIFSGSFLILSSSFSDKKFVIFILQISNFSIFRVDKFLILLDFRLGFWRIKVIFSGSGHDLIDIVELCFWS